MSDKREFCIMLMIKIYASCYTSNETHTIIEQILQTLFH